MLRIKQASIEEMEDVKQLFREYQQDLNVDLCFQDFEHELKGLPGEYVPPKGSILLARINDHPVGCVALKPLSKNSCEMKRLYVRPNYRNQGIGRQLAKCIIEKAQQKQYQTMKLDTLSRLKPALHLYRSLGFQERSAYYENPLKNVIYLELDL